MSLPARITGTKSNEDGRRNSVIGARKIPNAKKPKSRPPIGLRNKVGFLHHALPNYSGPYSVGAMDIEVPAENPRVFSHISRRGYHLLKLETVLMTIYYPAAFGSGAGRDPSGSKKWSRETWLPRPRFKTAKAYGKFAGIGNMAVPLFAATTMLTKIPAFRNPPPASHWPPPNNYRHGGAEVKNQEGQPPPGESEEPVFPLMIFSHGLGGTRTAYSSLCGEFASYGFVVCALEHRDGSGPRTYVNHAKEGLGTMEERESKGHIDHDEKQRKRKYDEIDYIFPKRNPKDTSPLNEKGVDRELRDAQTQLRLAEIEEAYNVLYQIRQGNGGAVMKHNLRRKGHIGASSRGLDGVNWSAWKDRFHYKRVTIAGHSFGAATTVEVLRNADRFKYVEQGIIYDIWGAVIKPPTDEPRHRISAPLLGINSEAFMYWPSNFNAVMSLMEEALSQGAPTWLCTVRGTVHVSQSDFSILYPRICSLFLKMTANPNRALDLNISASLEFLKDVMRGNGGGKAMIERSMTNEALLNTEILEDLPTEHRPDDKWIAARLKIPHEFRSRVIPQVVRKIKRKGNRGQYNPGDEIWMHVRTEAEHVKAWREKRGSGIGDRDRKKEYENASVSEEKGESY